MADNRKCNEEHCNFIKDVSTNKEKRPPLLFYYYKRWALMESRLLRQHTSTYAPTTSGAGEDERRTNQDAYFSYHTKMATFCNSNSGTIPTHILLGYKPAMTYHMGRGRRRERKKGIIEYSE